MNRGSRRQEEQQIDLTPMLDVVFIMLIFVIVTATFIKLPGQDVLRPEAVNAEDLKPSMLIAVNSDNEIWINREMVEPRFLKTQIAVLFSENPSGDLVIQADEDAQIENIALIADAAKEVGIEVVRISAEGS